MSDIAAEAARDNKKDSGIKGRLKGVRRRKRARYDSACEVVALKMEARVEDLGRTVHAHPTLSEAVKEAALAVHRMQIHA